MKMKTFAKNEIINRENWTTIWEVKRRDRHYIKLQLNFILQSIGAFAWFCYSNEIEWRSIIWDAVLRRLSLIIERVCNRIRAKILEQFHIFLPGVFFSCHRWLHQKSKIKEKAHIDVVVDFQSELMTAFMVFEFSNLLVEWAFVWN